MMSEEVRKKVVRLVCESCPQGVQGVPDHPAEFRITLTDCHSVVLDDCYICRDCAEELSSFLVVPFKPDDD